MSVEMKKWVKSIDKRVLMLYFCSILQGYALSRPQSCNQALATNNKKN